MPTPKKTAKKQPPAKKRTQQVRIEVEGITIAGKELNPGELANVTPEQAALLISTQEATPA